MLVKNRDIVMIPLFGTSSTRSILMTPIKNRGKLIGILYLENNLTTAVFTPERLEVLKILFSQAAISIDNAKLYSQVRNNERQMTQFLEGIQVLLF